MGKAAGPGWVRGGRCLGVIVSGGIRLLPMYAFKIRRVAKSIAQRRAPDAAALSAASPPISVCGSPRR